ncbi:hypothetical protein GQ44DRAFT_776536 [Phaeosphaeriaceae sp. PMI808]|nr:hypothetical protein GQ44DRAFT_776536 [Phaeosphaeriaceae sp. PMI808]
MTENPSSPVWLNMTIINAECLAGPPAAGSSSSIASAGAIPSTMAPVVSSAAKSSSAAGASSAATGKIFPDGTCAGINGFICEGSVFGDCCSPYGWCGSSTAHCGSGCQFDFGLCSAPSKVLPDGTCGTVQNNFGWICPGDGFGNYCSAYGWCGYEADHCDGGCQTAYGTCNAVVNALTVREASTSPVQLAVALGAATMTTLAATGRP